MDAAKWFNVTPMTLRRWLSRKSPIRVENVMRSRRVWPHVLRCLLVNEKKAGEL